MADLILRENSYRFDRRDKAEILRMMIKIAEYECPEGDEIDTIAKWIEKKALKLE